MSGKHTRHELPARCRQLATVLLAPTSSLVALPLLPLLLLLLLVLWVLHVYDVVFERPSCALGKPQLVSEVSPMHSWDQGF